MVEVARAASPSEARSPLPPVPNVEGGCPVGVPGVLRATAASGVPMGGVGSSSSASATELACATEPPSAPTIDKEPGRSEDSEVMVRLASPGSFFVVALVFARPPEVESASGSGVALGARSEPRLGGELRTGSGLGAESEPAAGVVVEAGIAVGVATWAGGWGVAEAAAAVAAGASVASVAAPTAGPSSTPGATSAVDGGPGDADLPDSAASVDGEPGEPASPRGVTRTRAGVPM
jgi:hypothetical protein